MKKADIRKPKRNRRVTAQAQLKLTAPRALKLAGVLVPIDFSKSSLEAIGSALPLVKHFGAELDLMHVLAPDYPLSTITAMPLMVPEKEVERRVRSHLKDVAGNYGVELRPGNIHTPKGRPFEEICRHAREASIDLIVISTRGNTGLKHLVLGSTAERVVQHSPCPVLVVRSRDGASGEEKGSFKKIVVPIDFSDCSMEGLAYARRWAREFGSTLVLLNSVNPQYYASSDGYALYDLPLLMRYEEKAARERMRDLVRNTNWEGLRVETALEIGHAGLEICARAKDRAADLIVISTHGATGLKHALLGSTAEYVVRHAECPVLVVPSHKRPIVTSRKGCK
jgi:nucleotide-binding universal stress UspA family protein